MADSSAKDLFKKAVAAAKSRDLPAARKFIQASIRKDPNNVTAWLVFASVAESPRDQLLCLKKVLELDPTNAQALKMVQGLGVNPEKLIQDAPKSADSPPPEPQPEEPPPTPTPPAPSPFVEEDTGMMDFSASKSVFTDDIDMDGTEGQPPIDQETTPADVASELEPESQPIAPKEVPIPQPKPRPASFDIRLLTSAEEAEEIASNYLRQPPSPDGIRWVKKDDNRAGENEIVMVRLAAFTAISASIIIPLTILGAVLWNTPFVRQLIDPPTPTRFSSLREPTGTPTPLTTPTITPGFTPTASPSPTPDAANNVEPSVTPTQPFRPGDPLQIPPPTDIILPGGSGGRAEADAAVLIAEGVYEPAIATLQAERENLGDLAFNANLYYQEALALSALGQYEEALSLLDEAETRRVELAPQNPAYIAALAAGRASVNLQLARNAVLAGNRGEAAPFLSIVERQGRLAAENEPQWAEPYILLLEGYLLGENFQQASDVVQLALSQPDLTDDLRFYLYDAEIAFGQGRYDDAIFESEIVLYADPASLRAHRLRTEAAVAQENWSLASLYTQTWLYFHALDIQGWTTLGEIRLQEGNPQLALEAFNQAIIVGENTPRGPATQAYIDRANIYESRGQYDLAYADISAAVAAVEDDFALQERQMNLAYITGDYTTAQQILETLREAEAIGEGIASFMEARLIAAKDTLVQVDYETITSLIDGAIGAIPVESQPAANALRARAYLNLNNPDTALNFINSALNQDQRLEWFLLRAQIYEAQDEYEAALLEFERVRALAAIIPVSEAVVTAADEGVRRNDENIFNAASTATAEAQ